MLALIMMDGVGGTGPGVIITAYYLYTTSIPALRSLGLDVTRRVVSHVDDLRSQV
jgi:hypothetical protein